MSSSHVLFAFDNKFLPFQKGLRLEMNEFGSSIESESNKVLSIGGKGAPDGNGVLYYGTTLEVNGELWMWYLGVGELDERRQLRVCLAKSKDGRKWEKPNLGVVKYGGSTQNNLVDLLGGEYYVNGCVVFHEPDDLRPEYRFKMVFESRKYDCQLAVAHSADGVSWTEYPNNPRGPWLEPAGGIKWNGSYYINGQGKGHWASNPGWALMDRIMVTHQSCDFQDWSEASCLGFRRDSLPPAPVTVTGREDGEQVHIGAGVWNRGNVIVGFYGQWHGHPTNDRRLVSIDLGLVISHDALHYHEPLPHFRIISAKETPSWWPPEHAVFKRFPALMQGQGFANIGDETLYWYSVWGAEEAGIRLARWERDRLGYVKPYLGPEGRPHLVTAPIPTGGKPVKVSLNAAGLNENSEFKVTVLDEEFHPIPGYTAADCTGPAKSGLCEQVLWGKNGQVSAQGNIRLRVDFAGVRPEDLKLYAIYVDPVRA